VNVKVVPDWGESPEEVDELGDVLTLRVPEDDGGGTGPKYVAIRESFLFSPCTSAGGESVTAFSTSVENESVEETSVAPAIRSFRRAKRGDRQPQNYPLRQRTLGTCSPVSSSLAKKPLQR
jgi:hypothetical protein